MQLFQLAIEQLRAIQKLIPEIKEEAARQSTNVIEGVNIPFLPMTVGAVDEPSAEPSVAPEIDLNLPGSRGKPTNYEAVQAGVNDFVYSALLMAFTHAQGPVADDTPMDDIPRVSLARDNEDSNQIYLNFERLEVDKFGVSGPAKALENMEKLMFNGWKKVNGTIEPTLRKRFISDTQCDITEHLIRCMARAAGYTGDVIEQNIEVSPNDRTLTINKEFLAHLAEVEQTLEADFGKRRD